MEKQELKQLFTGYWNYMAIRAACELKLFDQLKHEQHTFDTLLQTTQWNAKALDAVLQICQEEGLLRLRETIRLTNKGEYLISTNPEGLYHACLLWADEHLHAWQQMASVIRTGEPSFERIFGSPFFDYLRANPQKNKDYHVAMFEYAVDDYRDIGNQLNLRGINSLLDVGGGYGALISNIAISHPEIRCGLFDLPEVIAQVDSHDLKLHSGTFFAPLPSGYDAIVMSRVIHDWDNLHAELILKNVYAALPKGGTLYIVENLTNRMTNKAAGLTLNMMAMCKSFERTEEEYFALLGQCGFGNFQIEPLTTHQYIIQSIKL